MKVVKVGSARSGWFSGAHALPPSAVVSRRIVRSAEPAWTTTLPTSCVANECSLRSASTSGLSSVVSSVLGTT